MRSIIKFLPLVAALIITTSCQREDDESPLPSQPDPVVPSPDPDPNPDPEPEPQPSTMVRGVDISWLTEMENDGRKFFANQKMTSAVEGTQLMKDLGMSAVRLRVWVDPTDATSGYIREAVVKDGKAYCGKEDVVVKAKRAQSLGMDVMVDFHYSDSWADPIKQYIPTAWKNYTYNQLVTAVKEHTADVLTALKEAGVTNVKWVQVGNETHPGMLCYQYGKNTPVAAGGYYGSYPEHYAGFVDAGYEAVKSVYPEALVIVHHDKSNNWSLVKSNLDALKKNNARFDMVGLSFYPCEVNSSSDAIISSTTEANIKAAFTTVDNIYNTYNKETMFVEVGMKMWPDTNIPISAKYMEGIVTMAQDNVHCLGLFYWEPMAWWWNNYNMGAFNVGDSNGKKLYPNEIFDAFCK